MTHHTGISIAKQPN